MSAGQLRRLATGGGHGDLHGISARTLSNHFLAIWAHLFEGGRKKNFGCWILNGGLGRMVNFGW